MKRVFLGGTCNGSKWRDKLIPLLQIDYFNPVVEDWTPEQQAREILARRNCDFCLYTITKELKGVYSIAEVVDDSNKKSEKTVLCLLEEGLPVHMQKSLKAVAKMVKSNGAHVFYDLASVAEFLNRM